MTAEGQSGSRRTSPRISPVTIVTGAASGIGRASALRLAARGDTVALADLSQPGLAEVLTLIERAGGRGTTFALDVCDGPAVQRMCDTLLDRYGQIDCLFSNAGTTRRAPVAEMSVEDWRFVFDTNVQGAFNFAQAVLPHMVERRSGAILFTTSDFSIVGLRDYANYTSAKTALYSLSKSLAIEFGPYGIRVNAVGPGPIDTPQHHQGRTQAEWDAWLQGRLDRVPLGRLGAPDEVASVVAFLLSDRSAYISGQLVQPNGGQVMW